MLVKVKVYFLRWVVDWTISCFMISKIGKFVRAHVFKHVVCIVII